MKLKNDPGTNLYYVSNPKCFLPSPILPEDILRVFDFAYEMSFGTGFHRDVRSGGNHQRRNGEKFCNTFQGKLAEIVLFRILKSDGVDVREPDFNIYGKGIWDDSDLEADGKKINVKSAASQSNLLLLEKDDWSQDARYLPNVMLGNGSTSRYDYFVLVRIKPDVKKIFKEKKIMYLDNVDKKQIGDILIENNWFFDVTGYIPVEKLIEVIKQGDFLPKKSILNKYTIMDSDNYYVQSGDLFPIGQMILELNKQGI